MINKLTSKILLNIKGKNINRFIKKLTIRKIDILSLKYINKNEALITIYKKDYKTILKIKSIYEITEKDVYGYLKIKKIFILNKHIIIILIICFLLFYLLTHIILDIEVMHSNKEIRNLIKEELKLNGIKKYTLRKTYNQKEKIKNNIINKYPDKIEWLEIEQVGTKYIIRVEERKLIKLKNKNKPRNIIAKKEAVLKKIIASKGDIIKNPEDYVKKGDIIVNGQIMLNEKSKGKVHSEGKAYGEVWYVTKTEYPFVYYEEQLTGKQQNIYTLKFLNHSFEFTLNKFKNKKTNDKIIVGHNILPIKLIKQNQKELKIKNQVLTFDEALLKAKETARKKIEANLKNEEYIIRSKYLKSNVKTSTIEVEMFFAVYEDITDYQEIE